MRYLGRLTDWHDDTGYGFVVPNGGGDRAFVHIKAFERQGRRPNNGELVSYAVERDARGRLNAVQVRFARLTPQRAATARSGFPRKSLALVAFVALALATWRHALPPAVAAVYAAASAWTFVAYWWDKSAAQRGAWRTRESSLHAFALFGGWPGALLAQDLFRHKTRKPDFLALFWVTVVGNLGALAWWLHAAAR